MRLAECGSRPLQVQLRLLLVLVPGQPLFVARVITSPPAQWDDVVHLAVLAPWGFGVGPFEILDWLWIALDASEAVPSAAFTLDRPSTVWCNTRVIASCRIGGTTAGVSPTLSTASPYHHVKRGQPNQCNSEGYGKSYPNGRGPHATLIFSWVLPMRIEGKRASTALQMNSEMGRGTRASVAHYAR